MLRGRGRGVDGGMAAGLTTEGHGPATAGTATRWAELVLDFEGGAVGLVSAGAVSLPGRLAPSWPALLPQSEPPGASGQGLCGEWSAGLSVAVSAGGLS